MIEQNANKSKRIQFKINGGESDFCKYMIKEYAKEGYHITTEKPVVIKKTTKIQEPDRIYGE